MTLTLKTNEATDFDLDRDCAMLPYWEPTDRERERAAARRRSARARLRRATRDIDDLAAHDRFCQEQADNWASDAAQYQDMLQALKRDSIGRGYNEARNRRYTKIETAYLEAHAAVQWWEARIGERTPLAPPAQRPLTQAAWDDPKIEQVAELPEPTDVGFEYLSPRSQRKLTWLFSDARNWAWEPSGEWVLRGDVHTYRNGQVVLKDAQVTPKRDKPGFHIIGSPGDLGLGREAIVTAWSAERQQWIIARCSEAIGYDPDKRRKGNTQWIPSEYVAVPRRPLRYADRSHTAFADGEEPWVGRSALDAHSDRLAADFDTAVEWSYRWASKVREEHAEPEPADVLARGYWTSWEWAMEAESDWTSDEQ